MDLLLENKKIDNSQKKKPNWAGPTPHPPIAAPAISPTTTPNNPPNLSCRPRTNPCMQPQSLPLGPPTSHDFPHPSYTLPHSHTTSTQVRLMPHSTTTSTNDSDPTQAACTAPSLMRRAGITMAVDSSPQLVHIPSPSPELGLHLPSPSPLLQLDAGPAATRPPTIPNITVNSHDTVSTYLNI